MTESEKQAYQILRKQKVKSAADLAEHLECSRQRAGVILQTLEQEGLAYKQPAQWLAK